MKLRDGCLLSSDVPRLSFGWEDGCIVSLDIAGLGYGWEDGCVVSLSLTVLDLTAFKCVKVLCFFSDIKISPLGK